MIVGVIRAGEIAAAIVLGRRLNVVKRHGVFVDNDVAHDRDVAVTLEERSDARLHDGRPFAIRIDDGWCHHHSIIALSRSDLAATTTTSCTLVEKRKNETISQVAYTCGI